MCIESKSCNYDFENQREFTHIKQSQAVIKHKSELNPIQHAQIAVIAQTIKVVNISDKHNTNS
jgi:hypothetical protein